MKKTNLGFTIACTIFGLILLLPAGAGANRNNNNRKKDNKSNNVPTTPTPTPAPAPQVSGTCFYSDGFQEVRVLPSGNTWETCLQSGNSTAYWVENNITYHANNSKEVDALLKLKYTDPTARQQFLTEHPSVNSLVNQDNGIKIGEPCNVTDGLPGTIGADGKCIVKKEDLKKHQDKNMFGKNQKEIDEAQNKLAQEQDKFNNASIKHKNTEGMRTELGRKEWNKTAEKFNANKETIKSKELALSEFNSKKEQLEARAKDLNNFIKDADTIGDTKAADEALKEKKALETEIEKTNSQITSTTSSRNELSKLNTELESKLGADNKQGNGEYLGYRHTRKANASVRDQLSEAESKRDEARVAQEKAAARMAEKQEIMEEHQGDYDGAFRSLHSGVTAIVNQGIKEFVGVREQIGAGKVANEQATQTQNLANQGPNATIQSTVNAQSSVRGVAVRQLSTQRYYTYGAMVGQLGLGYLHNRSARKTRDLANEANGDLGMEQQDAKKKIQEAQTNLNNLNPKSETYTADSQALQQVIQTNQNRITLAQERMGNVGKNLNGVRNAQMMNTLRMAAQAAETYQKAQQLKREGEILAAYQDPNAAPQAANYAINLPNDAPVTQNPDGVPESSALQDQGGITDVAANDSAVKLDDRPQFNPNDPNTLPEQPVAGFAAGNPSGPQGAGSGNAGGVGGTSAAQEDGGPQAGPKAKDSAAGNYASSESGGGARGGTSKSGGGSNDVGLDSAFADLLKKLLPGGEPEKKDAGAEQVALGDRAPASDQAAVIGRNQNIFEVIHKRYLKKNQEGAVLYKL